MNTDQLSFVCLSETKTVHLRDALPRQSVSMELETKHAAIN